jgi:DnaJ-class molecular chaperone
MADPYATLGVPRGAAEADIKKAYRKLAKELHPDRNKDNPKAAERFAQVTSAYDLLSDADKRARFDRGEIDGDGNPAAPFGFGARGPGGPGPGVGGFRAQQFDFGGDAGDMGSIFEEMLGGAARRGGFSGGFGGFGRQPQAKGANISYSLSVPFTDAATLAPQRVVLGGGPVDLKLPAGVESGTQMRVGGKGEQGPGGAGDAIVTVEVQPHRFFTRDGDDVRLDLPVTLTEAVLGAQVRVPTVDGAVMLKVAPGSTSGRTLRLKGKGFHRKGGGRGDQLVTLMVDLPADDTALRAFAEGWTAGRDGNPRANLGV